MKVMRWLLMELPDLTEKRDGNHDDDDVRWWTWWLGRSRD